MSPTNESSKLQIASHGKRLIAFIIDFAITLLLVNTITRLTYKEHWDLHLSSTSSSWLSLAPFYLAILCVMIFKDVFKGSSPGKFVFGITIRQLDDLSKIPHIQNTISRNLFLLILPIEGVLLLMDSHGRRLGDKWSQTVVIENPKAARIIVRLMAINVIFVGYMFSAFFIQPFVMEKTAAYQTAVSYLQTHSEVINKLGIINDFESPELTLNINEIEGQALLKINYIGAKKSSYVQVQLKLMFPQRIWQAEQFEFEK